MGRKLPLVILTLLLVACAPLVANAHRNLRQLADPELPAGGATAAAAAAPELVQPKSVVFAQEVYAPTFPEAASLSVDTEVIMAGADNISSQSTAPTTISAADIQALEALVASAGPVTRCATNATRAQQQRLERQMKAALKKRDSLGVASVTNPTIPVWFHVIRTGTLVSQGNIPQTWIDAQINVMNAAFAGRFRFQWAGTTRTTNTAWWNLASSSSTTSPEWQMKQTLRRGNADTLNFYTSQLANGLLGWATFPGGTLVRDGVVCGFTTLPGNPAGPYSLGDTGTHEVGHWLNLYHTFQGGCTGGDMVNDTPAEATPDYDCARGRDSCPTLPGLDPITNFMNYGPDSCLEAFTPGQFTRMTNAWNAFRAPKICPATAAPGGACGATAGGACCPSGQCCSQWGWCGVTTSHCGAGCQRSFGTCT